VPRITEAELRKLFPQDNDTTVDVSHYIADANVLVTDLLGTSTLSEARLGIIERYIAAHLYVLGEHEGGIFEERYGDSMEKRGSTFTLGQGLKLTRWGQMAIAFDTTGTLEEELVVNPDGGIKKEALFRLV
jgi:hypothetical protein